LTVNGEKKLAGPARRRWPQEGNAGGGNHNGGPVVVKAVAGRRLAGRTALRAAPCARRGAGPGGRGGRRRGRSRASRQAAGARFTLPLTRGAEPAPPPVAVQASTVVLRGASPRRSAFAFCRPDNCRAAGRRGRSSGRARCVALGGLGEAGARKLTGSRESRSWPKTLTCSSRRRRARAELQPELRVAGQMRLWSMSKGTEALRQGSRPFGRPRAAEGAVDFGRCCAASMDRCSRMPEF